MDFDKALGIHGNWKVKLRLFLEGKKHDIKSEDVSKDNLCEFGQWLAGEGMQYKTHPEYQEMVALHTKFHKTAGEIARLIEKGEKKKAEGMLDGGDYATLSQKLAFSLMQLRKKVVEH